MYAKLDIWTDNQFQILLITAVQPMLFNKSYLQNQIYIMQLN